MYLEPKSHAQHDLYVPNEHVSIIVYIFPMYRPRKLPLEHYLCLLPARGAYNQGCTTGQLSGPCSDMASVSTGSLSVCPCPEVADKPTRTQKLRQSLNLRWLQKPGAHFRETTLVTSIYRDNASDQYITRRLNYLEKNWSGCCPNGHVGAFAVD